MKEPDTADQTTLSEQNTGRMVWNLLRRWQDATTDKVVAAWRHDGVEETHSDALTLIQASVPPAADDVATLIVQECRRRS